MPLPVRSSGSLADTQAVQLVSHDGKAEDVKPEPTYSWRVEEEFVGAIRGQEQVMKTSFVDGVRPAPRLCCACMFSACSCVVAACPNFGSSCSQTSEEALLCGRGGHAACRLERRHARCCSAAWQLSWVLWTAHVR